MNLHPILIHFPIALLTVYAVLEVGRVPAMTRKSWWFPVKSALLIIGSAASVPTYVSGWLLERDVAAAGEVPKQLAIHGDFALYTVLCFGLLALAHLVYTLRATPAFARLPHALGTGLLRGATAILKPAVSIPLAILGLLLVTATGALGGAMIYGPDTDPVARVLYDLLIGE